MNSLVVLRWLIRQVSDQANRPPGRRHYAAVAPRPRRSPSQRRMVQPTSDFRQIDESPTAAAPSSRPPGLEVRCFGRFEVARHGNQVQDWRRGKARTLLKVLVDRRHPVARDVLIELLWPNADTQAANNSLRVALYALRQALGPYTSNSGAESEFVIFADGNFHLNPETELWVDVDEFIARFEDGIRLQRQGSLGEAMRAYEQAEGLYRDDFLVEDMYEDWAVARRERLKDQYLLIVTKLADFCLDQGDTVGCILRCHKILHKDPCREDAYVRLMRCYQLMGQRSQALHWYDICARTLRKELDVQPLDATTLLCSEIAARSAQSSRRVVNQTDLS